MNHPSNNDFESYFERRTVIGYKVIRKGRLSCSIGREAQGLAQRYLKGVPTKRRKGWGPLCFFIDKKQAISFRLCYRHWPDLQIVKCEAKQIFYSSYAPLYRMFASNCKTKDYFTFELTVFNDWPTGTCFADEITCLE